jgi:hypothetical protein
MAARAMMNSKSFIEAGVSSVAESERFLRKSIQNGTINVYEFLARVANQLKKEYGGGVEYASSQFQANLNRMKNSVFEFYRMVGSSGAIKGLVDLIRQITALFNDSNGQGAAGLGQALGGVFTDLAGWVSKLKSSDISEFFTAIRIAIASTGIVVESFFELFKGFGSEGMKTPLLDFVEFVAKAMAALVDAIRIAVNGIKMILNTFMSLWTEVQLKASGNDFTDWYVNAVDRLGNKVGVTMPGKDFRDQYRNNRADLRAQAYQNDVDMLNYVGDANDAVNGGAYSRVSDKIAGMRNDHYAQTFGIDKNSFMNFTPQYTGTPMTGNVPSFLLSGGSKAGSSADDAANYVNPMGDAELQKFLDDFVKGQAPNASGGKKTPQNKSENQYLRDQTRMLKELATATNEYQNVLDGKNRKEGQAEAQMASLLQTDERYIKMTQGQKDNLMSWARQVDEANQRVRDAIKVQSAWNDALMAGYSAQRQISELTATGFVSKYTNAATASDSFKEGGENQFMSSANQSQYLAAQTKKDNDQRLLDMAEYTASIQNSNKEMMFQADLIGLSANEQRKMTQFREIDLAVQKLSVGASDEMIAKYREMGLALRTEVGSAFDYVIAKQSSMSAGFTQALADFSDQAANVSQGIYDVATGAFNGITTVVGQFAATGKADFKSFALSVISDFAKMEARILLSQVFNWIVGMFAGTGGVSAGYGSATGNYSWASSSGFGNNYGGFAKGAVFSGNPSLSAYSNGVYNTPQFFQQYAKGGVFGEAGAEAIMPLAKGSGGELGVKVHGGVGGGDVYVTVNTTINDSGATSNTDVSGDQERAALYKQFSDHMANVAQGEINRSLRPGGTLWKAGVSQK